MITSSIDQEQSMSQAMSREIHLKHRPVGLPRESDFGLAEVPIPEPAAGEVLVRNLYLSVDPYMRGRMADRASYVAPFPLGQPMEGGCVGQVVQSNGGSLPVGEYVSGFKGWREYYLSDSSDLTRIDPRLAPLQSYLGVMGMPGMTAYVGLLDIGQPKEGETVFVSAAAGAVGSVVCQIAKIKGCRVVASAGSDEKVRWLREEAGVDAAFNYKKVDDLSAELGRHCPNGVDIDFENVGGAHLEAALDRMNRSGRVVLCGMISQYNAPEPSGPGNLFLAITRRLRLQGFIVSDHSDSRPQFLADMSRWMGEGRIQWKETILDGIENAPKAFAGLFQGENIGKMLVRVAPDTGSA
jgi:NADPH-dependent curcumin reductase CurA